MKKTKKVLTVVLALSLVLSMAACGSSSSTTETTQADTTAAETTAAETEAGETEAAESNTEEETPAADTADTSNEVPTLTSTESINIIFAHNSSADCAAGKGAQKFKECMEEYSDGLITVEIYPDGQLGSVAENDQAIKEGTIQMMGGTTGGIVGTELGYFDLPYLVNSVEEFNEMFAEGTDLMNYTEQIYNDMGLQIISFVPGATGNITSNVEITCYEDFAGLNMRTNGSATMNQIFTDWGCNVTPLAFSELYIGLQQGLVDAQTNTFDTVVTNGLDEVQKYAVICDYNVNVAGMYMNLDFYNNLPDDVKELIAWVCENEVDPYVAELSIQAEEDAIAEMEAEGIVFHELTDEDKAKMREANTATYDLVREDCGDEVMDLIEAAQAELN
ncbi:MAG: TRAP transporter substrate-binding protein [Lachnospiraceae bacterium]|nr:TRAP transporter substrate-binding protein [Lachnospiraceae bacterium]